MMRRWSAVLVAGFALIALQGVPGTAQAKDPAPDLDVSVQGYYDIYGDCNPEIPGPSPEYCSGDVILENATDNVKLFDVDVYDWYGSPAVHGARVRIAFSAQEITAAGFTSAADLAARLTATDESATGPVMPWILAADGSASLELPPQDVPGGGSAHSKFYFHAAYSIREGTLAGSAIVTAAGVASPADLVQVTFYRQLTSAFFGRSANGNLNVYHAGCPQCAQMSVVGRPTFWSSGWGKSTAAIRLGEPRDSVLPGQYLLERTSDGSLYLHKPTATGESRTKVGWGYNQYDMFATAGDITGDRALDLVTRSPNGALWRYDGLPGTTGFAPRKQIGWGWGIYDKVIGGDDLNTDDHPDLLARDRKGKLWYYAGTANAAAPFAPRVQVGWGWDVYDQILLIGHCDNFGNACLVARDTAGKLWGYDTTGGAPPVITDRSQIGWSFGVYNTMF